MSEYKTEQKRLLLEFLAKNGDRSYTIDEIVDGIYADAGESSLGKSTVYRQLNQLSETYAVRRFRDEEAGRNLYQYVGEGCDCRLHFHEKCLQCGRIEHLDCHGSEAFAAHLRAEHGFVIDCGQTMLYGLCAECYATAERERGGQAHA